jgi:RNA 3'-terminal phosphate cyclase (ATP)
MIAAIPPKVADREIAAARKLLGWPEDAFAVRELTESQGPGNILLLEAAFEHVTEVVSGFGKLGVSAERVRRPRAGGWRDIWRRMRSPARTSPISC